MHYGTATRACCCTHNTHPAHTPAVHTSAHTRHHPPLCAHPCYRDAFLADIRVVARLGAGSFADCFRVVHKGRPAALKVLRRAQGSSSFAANEERLKSFFREARCLKLCRHE